MDRGPSGFMSEEMGLQLSSIPHQKVVHFNGFFLLLSLSDADLAALRSDSRFKWRKPNYNGTFQLDGRIFIDHDKYNVLVDQWPKGASPVQEWRLIGLDSTRRLLFLAADHWPFFTDLPPASTDP